MNYLRCRAIGQGCGREVCDDWVTHFWQIDGVWVPDFALPGPRGRHFCGTVG
jgi:hypothetical protein